MKAIKKKKKKIYALDRYATAMLFVWIYICIYIYINEWMVNYIDIGGQSSLYWMKACCLLPYKAWHYLLNDILLHIA